MVKMDIAASRMDVLNAKLHAMVELSAVQGTRTLSSEVAARQSAAEQKRLADKDGRLFAAYLNGHVSEIELARERARIRAEQERLSKSPIEDAAQDRIELLKKQMFSLNHVADAFSSGTCETKTALAGDFMIELTVNDGKLNARLKEPFATLVKIRRDPVIWTTEGSNL
jgi:hypothetical protein